MTVFDLITNLGSRGIKLRLDAGQLKFRAPKGAFTPELKQALIDQKQEVIAFLRHTHLTSSSLPETIPLASRKNHLKLSFSQQRLWFINQFETSTGNYNIPSAIRMRGKLKVDILAEVFKTIVDRHQILKTVFRAVNGVPEQVILPKLKLELDIEDISHLPTPERENLVAQKVTDDACTRFDLENGPLFNTRLLKLSADDDPEGHYILLASMHHIISDGWSAGVFAQEVATLYRAFSESQPSPLPPLSIQYADYAQWQRENLAGERLNRQLAFWKSALHKVPALELPLDHPRPAVQSNAGSKVDFEIPRRPHKKIV